MVLRRYKSILYLAYLAVRNDMRSKGIGSKALKQLVEDNAGCRTAVEYEAPCSSCESDMRSRRKGFYERCGFITASYVPRL
jgi:GNAT superfamily N-acetyltransferase